MFNKLYSFQHSIDEEAPDSIFINRMTYNLNSIMIMKQGSSIFVSLLL